MATFTNYARNALLDHTFDVATLTPPSEWHVAAFTIPPGLDTPGTEVGDRQPVTFDPPDDGRIDSTVDVEWDPLYAAADTLVVAVGIFDADVDGNLLAFEVLPAPAIVRAGRPFTILAGALAVYGTGGISIDLADAWLNHLFRDVAYTPPEALALAEFTVIPTATEFGTEAPIVRAPISFTYAVDGLASNDGTVAHASAASAACEIDGWAICASAASAPLSQDVLFFDRWYDDPDTTLSLRAGDYLTVPSLGVHLR